MGRISKVRIEPISDQVYQKDLKSFPPLKSGERLGVNKRFWKMLVAILKVAFPRCVLGLLIMLDMSRVRLMVCYERVEGGRSETWDS